MAGEMRTVQWDPERHQLRMIDQRLLPERLEVVSYQSAEEVADAIRLMVVRGAPAIGAAAAYGLALAAQRASSAGPEQFRRELEQAAARLNAARPTAVNLSWALRRMLAAAGSMEAASPAEQAAVLLEEAHRIADEDVATNMAMAAFGAELIDDGDSILHHCNTGALATVDWGTALGVIRAAHEQGKNVRVLVDETRPRLQGARLTAWELEQYGIPYEIIVDGAAGHFLRTGQVQKVLFGADRVAANGDVANKIGTYMLALAAHENRVPVYAVFPSSTADLSLSSGDQIPIEERDEAEVLGIQYHGEPVFPRGAKARNPAFDVTPHELITALVTEKGVIYPPFTENLARCLGAK